MPVKEFISIILLMDKYNWRNLSAAESEVMLPWMKFVHRNNMSMPNSVLITFGVLGAVVVALSLAEGGLEGFIGTIWIYILFAVIIAFAALLASDYRRNMRAFLDGDCMVMDVTVLGKVIGPAKRSRYYAVQLSGMNSDKRVYKKIYDNVSAGDRGYIVRFNTRIFMKIFVEREIFLPSCPL